MHVCHVVESKCIFVWTILSQLIELTTMVTYDAGLISGLFLSKSSWQVVFSQFLKVDNKSCHSQEEKHSNIILNKEADGSNQPVHINLNGSDCARTPDDKRTCTFHVR